MAKKDPMTPVAAFKKGVLPLESLTLEERLRVMNEHLIQANFVDPMYLIENPPPVLADIVRSMSPPPGSLPPAAQGVTVSNTWATPWSKTEEEESKPISLEEMQRLTGLPTEGVHVWVKPTKPLDPVQEQAQELTIQELKRRPAPQNRVFVKEMTVRYNEGMRSYDMNVASRFQSPSVEVDFTVVIPPEVDPNMLLNQLKTGQLGIPIPTRQTSPEVAGLEAQAEKLRAKLVDKDQQLARQMAEADKREAEIKEQMLGVEKTLLALRERMNLAIKATRDPKVAMELYREVLAHWSRGLAEGASFTAAEGEELATTLAEMLQYIDVAREVIRQERAESKKKTPAKKNGKQQLF